MRSALPQRVGRFALSAGACLLPALGCDHGPPPSLPVEFRQLPPADPISLLEGARLGPAALRKVKVGPTIRNAVIVPAPSRFEIRTRVPERARLAVGVLVLRPKGAGPSEGLHFELEAVTRDGRRRTLLAPFRAAPDAREELFDLEADPAERRNLSGEDKARAGALRTELEGLLRDAESRRQGAPGAVEIDKDLQDRLRALGYVH